MLLTIILSVVLIGLDQLTKYFAVQNLKPIGSAPFIPGIVEWRYLENDGAAFSMFSGQRWLLIIVTGIALLAVGIYLLVRRPKGKFEYLGLLFVFAGGVGNLIDRIANGYVVDFVNLQFMNFAIFNLADSLVVVGFILVAIGLIRSELRDRKLRTETGELPDSDTDKGKALTEEKDDKKQDIAAEGAETSHGEG